MTNIAVMGFGVVGSGVIKIVENHAQALKKATGDSMEVKRILVRRNYPNNPYEQKFTMSIDDIAQDESISVVVETMGGTHPAFEYISKCLKAGKNVVTSNKEVIANKGYELMQLAIENNVNLLFEASVGGAIPIVRPMNLCLVANNIPKIAGILNGTTNFILSKMDSEGLSFQQALTQAQQLGYAESDPTNDVEGIDALRKICILASMACGKHIYPDTIKPTGITHITLQDNQMAKSLGGIIKLIAFFEKQENGKAFVRVCPSFVLQSDMMYNIPDALNCIKVTTDNAGDVVFAGGGAGSLPTASAVVADVVHAVNAQGKTIYIPWSDGTQEDISDTPLDQRYFVHVKNDCKEKISKLVKTEKIANDADGTAFITDKLSLCGLNALKENLSENKVELLSIYPVIE